jgi:hypothetical protein
VAMPRSKLSSNDGAVLQHIFDPESAPTPELLIDASLPKDPHYEDQTLAKIAEKEKRLIKQVEAAMSLESPIERKAILDKTTKSLQELLKIFPQSAALHNDLAQVLRLRHDNHQVARSLIQRIETSEAAVQALEALNAAIQLLSPSSPLAGMSPTQCRTLAQAHMQRGAMRYGAVKYVAAGDSSRVPDRAPAFMGWTRSALEEAASRDFFMGGRYGNEIGRALAVHTNPTAKLCGQMVQDAMRREFALGSTPRSETMAAK